MEINLQCEILSPVHIGSGQEIEPFNYGIKDGTLYRIAFERLINAMNPSQLKNFEELVDSGDMIKLRRFIENHPDSKRLASFNVAVTPDIEATYRSNISNRENQMLIYAFLRSDNRPLMPGSSLKGAFRTAFLSVEAHRKKLPRPRRYREERFFENTILNNQDATNDPFRAIRIRDSFLDTDATIVRQIRNVLMSGSVKENSIQMMHEVSHSMLTGKSLVFGTSVSFDEKLFATNFLETKIGAQELIASCRFFFGDKLKYEHHKFYKGKANEAVSSQLMNTSLEDNECLIRVGRFSGVESVTLDEYRNPQPPGKKKVWGTSRNLVEGFYPMGWVKVNFDINSIK